MIVKYKRIQELLDERLGPSVVVRESDSEVVWRLWDEAVEQLSDEKPRTVHHHSGVYPLSAFVDGSELK
jgi:hypothetical protein